MHANPEENVVLVDELVLWLKDQPQIHHSVHPLALSAVIWIIFFTAIWPWRDLLKIRLKQFIMQDSYLKWMMLSSCGSLIKMYSHYPHC